MRTLYRERNQEEIRLRQIRNTENKDKSKNSIINRDNILYNGRNNPETQKNNEIKKQSKINQ
jgi:hypothetical protein